MADRSQPAAAAAPSDAIPQRRFELGFRAARDIHSIALHLQVTLSHSIADAHDEVVVAVLLRRVLDLSCVTCSILEQGQAQGSDTEALADIVEGLGGVRHE